MTPPSSDQEADSEWETTLSVASPEAVSKVFACEHDGCAASFAREKHLNYHRKTVHGERCHKCGECGASFTREAHLRRHRLAKHPAAAGGEEAVEAAAHPCDQCSASYASRDALRKHLRRAHGGGDAAAGGRATCEQCGKTFHKRNHLVAHVAQVHDKVLPHECADCGRRFAFPSKLKVHRRNKHERRKCGKCSEDFGTLSELRRHQAEAHRQEHRCEGCGRVFKSRHTRDRHLADCAGGGRTTAFVCPHEGCDKTYLQYRNLKDHDRVVHQGVRHECPEEGCGERFVTRRSLAKHLKTHGSGEGDGGNKTPRRKASLPRAPRRDRGRVKKSMASFLSQAELDPLAERSLVAGDGSELDLGVVGAEIGADEGLRESFRSRVGDPQGEEADDSTGAHLCLVSNRRGNNSGSDNMPLWVRELKREEMEAERLARKLFQVRADGHAISEQQQG